MMSSPVLPLHRRRRRCAAWCLLALAWALSPVSAAASPVGGIQIVTEELPPYNMTVDGKVTGVSTEIVEAVLRQAGIEATIQSMPWARAYELAKNGENVLIYSITRSPERLAHFKWVGVVAPSATYLYSSADRPLVLTRLEDAKYYRVATVNQDVGERYLLSKGFVLGGNLESSNRYAFNLEKLRLRRVDLWLASDLGARWLVAQSGQRLDDVLFRSLALPELDDDGVCMAFGARTSDAVVARFRQALADVRRNGTYDAIQKKWR